MIKKLILLIPLLLTLNQEISLTNYSINLSIGSLTADGEAQFIRGSRKVVTTDMLNTTSFSLKIGKTISKTDQTIISYSRANIVYQIHEDYTGGLKIYSNSEFIMSTYNLGFKRYFYNSLYKIYGAFYLGYVDIAKDLNVLSEEYLNPLPEDQVEIYPYTYKVHDYFDLGIEVGVEISLLQSISLNINTSYYITKLTASLENDPEDDGVDIKSSINPFTIDFGFIYYF